MSSEKKNKNRGKIKISDIAKAAGVSPSTVSYVLSEKRTISDKTKKKVMEQIELSGYKPNAVAQSLGTKKTYTIGFYYSKKSLSDDDYIFLSHVAGITSVLSPHNYKLLLLDEISDADEEYSIPINKSFAIDGAIVTCTRNIQNYLNEFEKEDMPFVLMGKPPVGVDAYYVDNDNQSVAYRSVEYLFQKGCTRIALVMGSDTAATLHMDYLAGYTLAHTNYQRELDMDLVLWVPQGISEDNFMKTLREKRVDGIIAIESWNPVVRSCCCYQNHTDNPLPVILFGFDLYKEFYSDCKCGHISYIDSNAYKLGTECAKKLLKLLEEKQQQELLLTQNIKQW